MEFIIIVSYIFITLVVYTILRFIKTDEDFGLHMMYSIFWPIYVAMAIIVGPFYLIDTLAKKSKRNKKDK
jgi:hypothetical protein